MTRAAHPWHVSGAERSGFKYQMLGTFNRKRISVSYSTDTVRNDTDLRGWQYWHRICIFRRGVGENAYSRRGFSHGLDALRAHHGRANVQRVERVPRRNALRKPQHQPIAKRHFVNLIACPMIAPIQVDVANSE
ncbi:hypothetical protein FA95DRAFT_1344983 [Auriscalpium vulgare]|uniref:Uncharacterized protein n=1 Tax=Auriscalpium vulgare TaxID=40419 RepID=A0ACB8R1W8_9AGAM|nr:hypothetical protein FA95DRAFT_1344983 [Auriscalpium vulgare]